VIIDDHRKGFVVASCQVISNFELIV